jgi:hypothetical protein
MPVLFWTMYPTLGWPDIELRLRSDVLPRAAPEAVWLHLWPKVPSRLCASWRACWRPSGGVGRLAAAYDRRSRMGAVLDELLRSPAVTPKMLVERIGLSQQSATGILGKLQAERIIRECTGRESFRAFTLAV